MAKKIKSKKCPICGNLFIPTFSTLQPVCGPLCAIKFNSEKEVKKRVEQMKVEVEGTSKLEQAAKLIFQQWIRERDKHYPCISCGSIHTKMDAGHFYKAELFSGLIFEEDNVHKQCCACNQHMDGNLIQYRKGLVARYGSDFVEQLDGIADANRYYKYTRSELIDLANKYKLKLKQTQANPKL